MISGVRPEDCDFCDERKIAGSVEHMYAADSSDFMVFEPLDPVVPGHLLVVPVVHVQDAAEDPLVTAMGAGVAARVAQQYRAANIITSIGVPATQRVTHLYWHVVPRQYGDRLALPWSSGNARSPKGTW